MKVRSLLRRPTVWCGILVLGLLAGLAWFIAAHYRSDKSGEEAARQRGEAQQALDCLDLAAAANHLEAYVLKLPDSAEGHFLLAQTLRRDGKFDEGEHQLAQAQRLGWNADAVGQEHFLSQLQRQGVRETATDALLSLVKTRDYDRPLLESLYRGDLALKNWDRAELWLHVWLEHYPDDWAPRLWQAELRERFKKYDLARADYLRVLELRPDQPQALLEVGLIAIANRGDYAEAEQYLGRYLEHDPNHLEAKLGLARCAYGRGNLTAARKGATDVFNANPRSSAAALLLGTIEAEAEHDEEALRWLRLAEAGGDNAMTVQYELAQVLRRLGQTEEADKHMRRFADTRDASLALGVAVRAADREPHNADRLYDLGRAYLKVGDQELAAQWFLKALKEDPAHRPSHAALADYYGRFSDPDAKARAEFHRRQAGPRQ